MQRRTFLKTGIAAVAGAATTGIIPAFARSIQPLAVSTGSFSLNLATDDAEPSMRLVHRFLKQSGLGHFTIRAEMRDLPGAQVGDLVFFNGTSLVDYRSETGHLADQLRRMASAHEFPREMSSPVLLQYNGSLVGPTVSGSTIDASVALGATVVADNTFVGRISLDRDIAAQRIENPHGYVTIAVENRSIRIVDASCHHKTCMHMGAISQPGETLACIPSRVSIVLDGEPVVDSISM